MYGKLEDFINEVYSGSDILVDVLLFMEDENRIIFEWSNIENRFMDLSCVVLNLELGWEDIGFVLCDLD